MMSALLQDVPDPQITRDWERITECLRHFCKPSCIATWTRTSHSSAPKAPHATCTQPCSLSMKSDRLWPASMGHLQVSTPQMSPWTGMKNLQLLQTGGIPLKSQEFVQVLPPENAAYCSSPIHLPTANIYIENRFREGEIDNIVPDTLSVGWTAIYLVSDQTYQLWTKFHNCRRLCVATSTKKCGIVHYGLTDLYASNMSCRLRELCYRIFVVVAVELKRCSSSLWSLRLVVNSLKSALFPFILAC